MRAAREHTWIAIETTGLTKRFSGTHALHGPDLWVDACTVLGPLNPSAAEKTTLIRTLATLERPDGGHAHVNGFEVTERLQSVRRAIGPTGQYTSADEDISGRENLYTIARLLNLRPRRARVRAEYRQYLISGIMALTVVSRTTGIDMAVDFDNGTVDWFRSLPITHLAVFVGRIIASTARMLVSVLVILVFALFMGFQVNTGPLQIMAAILLLLWCGIALAWVSAFIGLVLGSVQSVAIISALWMNPCSSEARFSSLPTLCPTYSEVSWNSTHGPGRRCGLRTSGR